jgi:hypothetical protein
MLKNIEIEDELYELLREKGKTGDSFTKVIKELIKKPDIQEKSSNETTSSRTQRINEPLRDNIIFLEPIMQITNRGISRIPPDGTRVRFRFRGRNYETQLNTIKYKYRTLNSIYRLEFKYSIDIWHANEIYFNDEDGWHPLKILRG